MLILGQPFAWKDLASLGGGVIEAPPSQHTLQKRNLGFMLLCVIFWSYYNYVIYECLAHCLGLQTEPGSDRGDSVNTKHENNKLKKKHTLHHFSWGSSLIAGIDTFVSPPIGRRVRSASTKPSASLLEAFTHSVFHCVCR